MAALHIYQGTQLAAGICGSRDIFCNQQTLDLRFTSSKAGKYQRPV
jgi:hypothetical protein